MEKSCTRRRASVCSRLLRPVFLAGAFVCSLLFTVSDAVALESEIRLSVSEPVAGESFSVAFVFYGCEPDEVSAQNLSPEGSLAGFPPSFAVDTFRKTLTFLSPPGVFPARNLPTTVVSVDVLPSVAGSFETDAFVFFVGNERVVFEPLVVFVGNAPGDFRRDAGADASGGYTGNAVFWLVRQNGRFVPAAGFSGIAAGESAVIALAVPETLTGEVLCPAPENALLVGIPLSGNLADGARFVAPAAARSLAAAFSWTPLSAGTQQLPQAVFAAVAEDGTEIRLSAAPCAVEVLPALAALPAPADATDAGASDAWKDSAREESGGAAAFPAAPVSALVPELPAVFSVAADSADFSPFERRVAAKCRALWGAGEYAMVAALLRTAERRHAFSSGIAEMRGAVDAALSVRGRSSGLVSVFASFLPVLLVPAAILLFALAFVPGILRKIRFREEGGRRGEAARIGSGKARKPSPGILAAAGAVSVILVLCLVVSFVSGGITEVAAKRGSLFRIPESGSTPICEIAEGCALKILERAGDWVYVETESGASGWYPFENTVVYTCGDLNEFR